MRTKEEFRKIVAEQFTNVLNEKDLDWVKEWHTTAVPINAVSSHQYRGINQFYLSIIAMTKGWKDPRWMTFNQIAKIDKKAMVRKGEHAFDVEYWFVKDRTKRFGEKDAFISFPDARKLIKEGKRQPEDFQPVAKYFKVFNAEQVEGLPPMKIEQENKVEINQADLVNTLSQEMNVPINFDGGDNAYYSPKEDAIHLPAIESFKSEYAFNSTALHELAHSTGHPDRLNRSIKNIFGSEDYAFEELIAEMTSCFMALETVSPESLDESNLSKYTENHKAYVQSWAQSIKDKPDILFKAIKEAEHAADYMDMKAGLLSHLDYLHRYQKDQPLEMEGEIKPLITNQPLLSENGLAQAKSIPKKLRII
ncbi:MAG: zincin-like metallopeptidase domain-containing protein [Solobacterium sp.]|jgi:antirestriction protein ArdC|nr:zincin-like metallopeptidase domain-containing protein [Solobacterium sp.]